MVESPPAKGNILGKWIPARYILTILGSIGMAIVYGLKVNLSVAMVAMVNHSAVRILNEEHMKLNSNQNLSASLFDAEHHLLSNLTEDEVCDGGNATQNMNTLEDGQFLWNEVLQGILLSCYFWGYFISQIPGARIAELYSAKWVMFFSVAINVICTLLTPLLTKLHYSGLLVLRILEGIGGGATFPAMHVLLSVWAPPNERSIMSTITYAGTSLGTAISIILTGVLASHLGWESVFYVMGGLSCIWMILWITLIQDNPSRQTLISIEEREFIISQLNKNSLNINESSIERKTPDDEQQEQPEQESEKKMVKKRFEKKKLPIPWKEVFKSVPFWAILIAHVCSNWGWYMFLIEIPLYMKQVLHFNVSDNAFASARPYFPMLVFSILLGKILDMLRTKKKITTTMARKIATICASLIPSICLLVLCFARCNHVLAVTMMSIGIISMGGMFCGYLSNHIDIAPNYAGTLIALTNTIATLPGIIVPIFVGFITEGNQTISAWRIIFYVTIVFFLIEIIIFALFCSGEEQSWNKIALVESPTSAEGGNIVPTEETPLREGITDQK